MPRPLRSAIYRPQEIAILHCTQRCVRRAYLSGVDAVTGADYSYRKEWIQERIEKLASVFGLDILTYAILSNHLHVFSGAGRMWLPLGLIGRWLFGGCRSSPENELMSN